MVEERDLIADWQQGRLSPEDAPQEIVDALTVLANNPIAAVPDLGLMRVAQRIEELTQLVGRIAHANLTAIPAGNISTNISQPQPNISTKQNKE